MPNKSTEAASYATLALNIYVMQIIVELGNKALSSFTNVINGIEWHKLEYS